ncbi:hypothetical protein NX722_13545 [Endozoicomonas gorgoniicola]|uniref:Uncharacterized protein n=1 Tax=Endozoicomonas gorgoniicola TaxID=1234144 RepID=A0ABT3MW72_9GAMM|nr:hypothetical protein [Endozoicomonas gorgoniicola]MCW7553632.1 hypothetical protein [Endozoicomonas gorgoniicola]
MTEIPASLRKLGITHVSDNLGPDQVIDPKKAATCTRIFFQQELQQFLERYQQRQQEGIPCQVSEESIAGNQSKNVS